MFVQKTEDADPAPAEADADPAPDDTPAAVTNGTVTPASTITQTGDGQHMDFVEIPAAMVGKLIGKSGETIKALQFTTHTKVQIDHQGGGDLKKVSIMSSSKENIIAAKAQIDKIVNSDEPVPGIGEVSKQVECPPGIVGRIIGRGGETIRALQQASMAHIVVDQNFPEGQNRVVNIKGRTDAVERATKMVQELIQGEPGSAQAIIQKVRTLCLCFCTLFCNVDPRLCLPRVGMHIYCAVSHLSSHPSCGSVGISRNCLVSVLTRMCVQYGAGINSSIDCPKQMVGRVIGKGGETIKALQKQFGVNIQIDQQAEPNKITIAGPPSSVANAVVTVQEIINGGNPLAAQPAGSANFGGAGRGAPMAFPGGLMPHAFSYCLCLQLTGPARYVKKAIVG